MGDGVCKGKLQTGLSAKKKERQGVGLLFSDML